MAHAVRIGGVSDTFSVEHLISEDIFVVTDHEAVVVYLAVS